MNKNTPARLCTLKKIFLMWNIGRRMHSVEEFLPRYFIRCNYGQRRHSLVRLRSSLSKPFRMWINSLVVGMQLPESLLSITGNSSQFPWIQNKFLVSQFRCFLWARLSRGKTNLSASSADWKGWELMFTRGRYIRAFCRPISHPSWDQKRESTARKLSN
jgi:hypothetical protein